MLFFNSLLPLLYLKSQQSLELIQSNQHRISSKSSVIQNRNSLTTENTKRFFRRSVIISVLSGLKYSISPNPQHETIRKAPTEVFSD